MTRTLGQLTGADGPDRSTAIAPPPRRWKQRILLPASILVIMLALLGITLADVVLPARPVQVVPVVVKTIQGGPTESAGGTVVQAPGWLEPDPHPYFIAALAGGVVERVVVLEGEEVEAGQVVVELVDDDAQLVLARAKAELEQRRAEARTAEADLEAARLDLEHLVERTLEVAVAEGRVAEVESEILKARAEIAAAESNLLEVQDEYERKRELVESGAVSDAAVARLLLAMNGKAALVEAARSRVGILESQLAQARAAFEAAVTNRRLLIQEKRAVAIGQANLDLAHASVELAEVARDEAQLRYDRMQVRAPMAGTIMRRLVSPGSEVAAGPNSAHVLSMYDPSRMQMRVDVPLADAAMISIGQRVEIIVEVLPDRVFAGRVSRVVHEADIQKNTVEVKVAIDDPTSELKPEMLARARFLSTGASASSGSSRQRIFVPESIITSSEAGQTAFVVRGLSDGRGRVEARAITPGGRQLDGWIEVEAGLQPGDLLVANADPSLKPGDRVRIVENGEGRPR